MFSICSFEDAVEYPRMSGTVGKFHAGSLFFAAAPDADAAACIYRSANILKRARKFEGELIELDRLHVTLFFLGGWREHIVRMAFEAATEIRTNPFEVSFDRTASFRGRPGNHPFVLLGDSGLRLLMSFRQMLGAAMTRSGLRQLATGYFTPHITLLYDARYVEEEPIEPISWTMKEFLLIHSLDGHVHLARWPLRT
jgi:RNA 2',3'-cyclic 3'-phosphodiesterase